MKKSHAHNFRNFDKVKKKQQIFPMENSDVSYFNKALFIHSPINSLNKVVLFKSGIHVRCNCCSKLKYLSSPLMLWCMYLFIVLYKNQ